MWSFSRSSSSICPWVMGRPSSFSARARAIHSRRQVVNFLSGEKYTASPGWRSGRPRGFHRCLSWGPLLFPLCGLLQRIIRTRLFYHKTGRETIPFPPPCGCAILKKHLSGGFYQWKSEPPPPRPARRDPAGGPLLPPAEAAPKAAFRDRLAACPQTCWLLWEGDTLLAMVNGMTVQTPDLTDAMYETTALHDPAGPWLMIFGVDTHPDHRRRGYAGRLLRHAIQAARDQGRAGVVLTCKERLLPYYAKFGFVSEGCPPRCMAGRCGTRCGWLFEGGPAAVGVGPRWAAFFWGLPHAVGTGGNGGLPGRGPISWEEMGKEPQREEVLPSGLPSLVGLCGGSCTSRWLPGLRPSH